ncbi:molybdenum cofactor guanylyltransferase [Seonamhaeicola aphaedonensis]|uniref:Probable molybdenum cofactor guanylyltransferase n=1 Tax=Seonamhaeicola aphaedonensis TaxID=1461338 RepID=A0A3D9H5W3_9FLAO|nr:molybdenum cofactor guanylyltransferase [Seonamhaeicola aphaedonensis]RED44908.1 molybdenum cofactor guanylyltransferase [Seonamhaeicola aphaedonensis]
MTDKKDITGIILAGGKSSRMGSDKGLIKLNDESFIEYSIKAMKPLVNDILIVSDNPDYDVFGYKRIEDDIKDAGPVAGICSGLNASETENNLILSCDIPLIKTNILEKLINSSDEHSEIIQIESNGKTMPLIAMYKKQCAPTFLKALKNDERRLRQVISTMKTKNVVLTIEEQSTTMNVNTQEELKTIEHVYNG